MTRLYNWYIAEDEFDGRKVRRIQGIITGDEKYRDSTPVRTAGICSIVKDYKQDQLIVTTEDGRVFFCPLIYLNFQKYEEECPGADFIPDYDYIKERYAGKIPYPEIEPGNILLVLSNFDEYYFHSVYCRETADSQPLDFSGGAHIGMNRDSYVILAKDAWINIGYFPRNGYIELYRTRTGGMPLYLENIGSAPLRIISRTGELQLKPGERKLVYKTDLLCKQLS